MGDTPGHIRARNVATVHELYRCERDRDLEGWTRLWHPDGVQDSPFAGFPAARGIEDLRATTAEKFATRGECRIDDTVIACDDPQLVLARVAVSLELLRDRPPFEGELWVMFTFDSAGRILREEEAIDTAAVAEYFGDGGSTVSRQ